MHPALKYFEFKYHFTDTMVEDFLMNQNKVSVILLSLSYHIDCPLYLKMRLCDIKERRPANQNRFLLLYVDIQEQPYNSDDLETIPNNDKDYLTEITMLCVEHGYTLLCAFDYQ